MKDGGLLPPPLGDLPLVDSMPTGEPTGELADSAHPFSKSHSRRHGCDAHRDFPDILLDTIGDQIACIQ
jgi:hypothetical protein